MLESLRFLFVGRFSQSPKGDRITVSGDRMADVMARLDLRASVEVADRLGSAPTRRYELELSSARALRVADVWGAHEPLRSLGDIATALVRPSATMSLADAIAKVRALVGDGALVDALTALQPAPPSPSPSPAPATSASARSSGDAGASSIDAIFAQAEVPSGPDTVTAARSSIDAFVGAMRKTKVEGGGKPTAPGQRASALILDAIEATAADALGHEPAASIEAGWRGLKLALGESPGHGRLAIEILDVDEADRTAALRHALEHAPADAVFVVDAPNDLAIHAELAALGAATSTPMVVALDPGVLDAGHSPLSSWVALRSDPNSAWLCAVTNDIVLACETTRVGPRVVFGAPVFAIAAMLGASLRRDGTFGDAFGRAGAIVGPASWPVDGGRGTTRNLPVRAPLAVDAMRTMVESGISVLGSEPGGERLLAVGAPMVAKADGPTLAGRILVGRAVRAATLARNGLAHTAGPAELEAALLTASAEILPDGPPGTCVLRGRAEGSQVVVAADFRAHAVGRAFAASFRV
jgi:hypothetical protein